MQRIELSYPSRDGASTVHALLWLPDAAAGAGGTADPVSSAAPSPVPAAIPRGLVQIVHGMSEHIGRYERFAVFLTAQGFAVCANDHVGHGKTAGARGELGHIPLKNGADVLVEDVHELRQRALRELVGCGRGGDEGIGIASPDTLPYVIFGHSMGSFITRVYLTRHAFGVRAAVICGTGQQSPVLTAAGRLLTDVLARVHGDHGNRGARGERHRSALVHAMGVGAFARSVRGARTEADWIATDPAVVDAYNADPLCGQVFTVGGYHTVSALAAAAQNRTLAAQIPHSLPMLFIAGDRDPVGGYGTGVRRAAEEYRRVGVERVDVKLYPGYRHEILNEPCRDQVQADVLAWLEACRL